MIFTNPEVLDYIKGFEKIEEENPPSEDTELSSEEQIILFTLTKMFSIDKIFQLYISFIVDDYATKCTTFGKEELQKALTDTLSFISSLNKKET